MTDLPSTQVDEVMLPRYRWTSVYLSAVAFLVMLIEILRAIR